MSVSGLEEYFPLKLEEKELNNLMDSYLKREQPNEQFYQHALNILRTKSERNFEVRSPEDNRNNQQEVIVQAGSHTPTQQSATHTQQRATQENQTVDQKSTPQNK